MQLASHRYIHTLPSLAVPGCCRFVRAFVAFLCSSMQVPGGRAPDDRVHPFTPA